MKDFKQWREDVNFGGMGRSLGGATQKVDAYYVRLVKRYLKPIADAAVDDLMRRDPNQNQNSNGEMQIRQQVARQMINAINYVVVGGDQSRGNKVNYNQMGRSPGIPPQQGGAAAPQPLAQPQVSQ